MRDQLKDRAIDLIKATYQEGYEDGLKDRHDHYEEICQGLWREVEEWESRIDVIKQEIREAKSDNHAGGVLFIEQAYDICLAIIDKYCEGDKE